MNIKRYSTLLFVFCMLSAHGNNKVSNWTKLCNGIIPSSWYAPVSIASATTMFMAKNKFFEVIEQWRRNNDIPRSLTVVQGFNALSYFCVLAMTFAPSSPLYKRTEGEIKRAAEELAKEILILTEDGLLSADEIVQKLEISYVTDLDTHLIKATWYVKSLIARAEWYNQKLQIMGTWEFVPYTNVLKAVLQKLVTSPLFASQRSARRWELAKKVTLIGATGVVGLVAGVQLLTVWLASNLRPGSQI